VTIDERAEPPRMNRRWPVLTFYRPIDSQWEQIRIASKILGRSGLVPELLADENNVTLYAARRLKSGRRGE
jgi:hypothetical protein